MNVTFKNSFLKSIGKLRNAGLKKEIAEAIDNVELAANIKEIRNIKKLKGYPEYYRIKINGYRIGIKITNSEVFFVEVDHRKDI
jgi:mRNA interferase RelE/StbE